jgi:Na+/melibiose symporter-like transporter
MGLITEFIGTIGIIITSIFIPLFINFGDPSSFQISVIPVAIIFVVTLSLGIFGLLEEKELIDTYFSPNQAPKKGFLISMFKGFTIFKRKNFLVLLFRWIAFGLFGYFFISGLIYFVEYVLGAPYFITSIILMGYTLWSLIALPLSFLLSYFIGHLKVTIISGFVMGAALLPFLFINDIFITIILSSIVGFTFGLGVGSIIPLVGDVFDEHANINRRRSEGVSYGILNMFGGLTVILGAFITTFVQSLTGFNPGWWGPQPPLAILGIKILNTTIPGILIIVVMILFTVLYDLKPEKTEAIRMELKELEL